MTLKRHLGAELATGLMVVKNRNPSGTGSSAITADYTVDKMTSLHDTP